MIKFKRKAKSYKQESPASSRSLRKSSENQESTVDKLSAGMKSLVAHVVAEVSLFTDYEYMRDILEAEALQRDVKSVAVSCLGEVLAVQWSQEKLAKSSKSSSRSL